MDRGALTIEEAAGCLGVHYMTVYRYVRVGRLPAEYRDGRWYIEPDDLDQVGRSKRPRGVEARTEQGSPASEGPATNGHTPPRPSASLGGASSRMLDRLLAGDGAGAWLIVENALLAGGPADVYLEILAPCLRQIGEEWQAGRLTIAEEHRATALALGTVGRLGPLFGRQGRRRPGCVLLAGAESDPHTIPLIMVADLLRAAGFNVIQLGADVPVETLLGTALATDDLLAIGLSASTAAAASKAAQAVARLHETLPGVPVMVGGPGIPDHDSARALGADGWAPNAVDAVDLIMTYERQI